MWKTIEQFPNFEINESGVDKVYESLKKIVTLISDAEARVAEKLKSSECVWEEVIAAINKEESIANKIKVCMATSQAVQLLGSAASIASFV